MEKIVRKFKIEDLENKEVIAFLPRIISKKDIEIMEDWCNFFEDKRVPFVVTVIKYENQDFYKLYKLEKTNEKIDSITFKVDNFEA